MTTILELSGVAKSHGDVPILTDIDLAVTEGELIAIVGFSGAGKSTLVSLMAGLDLPDRGTVSVRGIPVTGPGPDRGVVFQTYALMPWLSARANVALAVDATAGDLDRAGRAARTESYLAMVGLAHAGDRKPSELSGGMRQRVSLARALAMRPEILLLDEPLSALDALTRAKLQEELEAIRAREGKTIVLVTNDVDEALLLADRIVPLTPGPEATLGPIFTVPLVRPRDPTALTHDPVYKKLRADLTAYLMGLAKTRSEGGAIPLPRAIPVDRSGTVSAMPTTPDRYVEFSQVSKTFPTADGPLTVVDGFDLKIAKGEFISLIGHSGCGKSTVLGMAAGLAEVTEGGIILDGREVTEPGPDRAVVFQAPSLFPWLTASGNVALGVDRAFPHLNAAKRRDIVHHYLDRVGLGDALDRPASSLSIGMRQRVGIARAFALNPKLLLLDEPFGMLDTLTRWDLQEVLMEVWARTRVTAICVTHDVDEAILLADRVVMMTGGPNARIGKVLKVDIPRPRSRRALLDHPRYYEYREQVLAFLENHETGSARAGAAA